MRGQNYHFHISNMNSPPTGCIGYVSVNGRALPLETVAPSPLHSVPSAGQLYEGATGQQKVVRSYATSADPNQSFELLWSSSTNLSASNGCPSGPRCALPCAAAQRCTPQDPCG